MIRVGLDVVQRSADLLSSMGLRGRVYAPLRSSFELAGVVDERLHIHVVRLGETGRREAGVPRPAEMATVVPGSSFVRFRPITPDLFDPMFPTLAIRDGTILVGVVAAPAVLERGRLVGRYQAMLVSPSTEPRVPDPILEPVNEGIRVALAPNGDAFVLAPAWYPPIISPLAIPLRVAVHRADRTCMVIDPVPGTDSPWSFPRDAAMHVSGDAHIHIVYDGVRGTRRVPGRRPPLEQRLFHVELAPDGALLAARDLGPAPTHPIMTAILTAPSGRLHVLSIAADAAERSRLGHTLIELDAIDEPGRAEHYLIDPWLQVHGVWFEEQQAHCLGPDSIPRQEPS